MKTSTPSDEIRRPTFDVRAARAFLFVAEDLHFGRAAARLHTSQPALSRTIHALEETLGVSLLERSTRRVALTAAGEVFSAECRLALGHLERAVTGAQDAAIGRVGRIRIGYMDFAIHGSLPWLLKGFRSKFPNDVMDLEYYPSVKQKAALLEGLIDVGFVIGQLDSPKVKNVLVDLNDYVALLPDLHPLAKQPRLRLSDMAKEPFVLGTEDGFGGFRSLLLPVCYSRGFFPNIVQETSSTGGILGMVAAGVGVSIFAGCARNWKRDGVIVKPLVDVTDYIPTYAIWATDNQSGALKRFGDFVLANSGSGPTLRPRK
jgi:DNA-binding transcriptional LysR family regulator